MSNVRQIRSPAAWLVILWLVLSVLRPAPSAAEEVSVEALVESRAVPVGGQTTLVVKVNGKFRKSAEPQLPSLDEFDVYKSGTSQSFSIVNGRPTATLQFNYTLVAKKAGTYTIAPIRFQVGDDIYTADPVQIEVVQSAPVPPPPDDQQQGDVDAGVDQSIYDTPIFVAAHIDRDTVYVNQQITWTLGFYTDGRANLLRTPEFTPPSSEGFWVEDLPPQRNYTKSIKGRHYTVNEIKRGFFPTAPGEYTIGSARVEVVLDDMSSRSIDDFFNFRLRTFGFGKPKTLSTAALRITVLPLPRTGRPADFSGLVGRDLKLVLQADKQIVRAGEPVNVTLQISGEGNFKTMAAPKIPELPGFKMYESGSKSDLFKSGYVVSGRKRTDFVLIPKSEGKTIIPSVDLSYFDPVDREYKSIRSNAIHLEVTPGEVESGRQVVFTGSGQEIDVIGTDIHFIHGVPASIDIGGSRLYQGRLFLAIHALPLLAVVFSLAVERRRRQWRADEKLARASRAARKAEKRLRRARDAVDSDATGEALSLVSQAIRGYVADKMNVSASGLTHDSITDFLESQSVAADDVESVVSLLRDCDSAQYTRTVTDAGEAIRLVDRGRETMKKLEKRYFK